MDPYRPQTSPGGSTALSGASPGAFGAGLGEGLESLGGTVNRIGEKMKAQRQDADATAAGLEFAQVQTEIGKAQVDAELNAAPGGAGHEEAMTKIADERIAKALGNIRDPHVRNAFSEQYARLRSKTVGDAYAFEASSRADKMATDFGEMGSTLAKGVSVARDPEGLQISLETVATAGGALNVSDALKQKLIRSEQHKIAIAYGDATVNEDPHLLVGDGKQFKGLLADQRFNRYLQPEDIDRLRDGAEAEIRRQEAAARQKANLADAQTREEWSAFKTLVSGGYDPTDEDFAKWTPKIQALNNGAGDASILAELKVRQSSAGINRETKPWLPQQYDAEINRLAAKGDKATPAEQIRLKQLRDIAPTRKAAFQNDPFAWAAQTGHPAPQVDWSNPASVQARVTWARSMQKQTGLTYVPYLDNNEKAQLKAELDKGPVGQVSVASQLRSGLGVAAGTEVARQLGGGRELELLVGLPEATAQSYKRGVDAVGQNGKLFDNNRAAELFNEYRAAIPGDLQGPVFNMARAIAADSAARAGHTDLKDDRAFDDIFRAAVNRAGGALGGGSSSSGGFAQWRGRRLWLPPNMTGDEAQRRITRSAPAAWVKAGNGEPYYRIASGRLVKLPPEQLRHLSEYQLETVNPGVYVPTVGGKALVTKDGKPWSFDIRRLGQ